MDSNSQGRQEEHTFKNNLLKQTSKFYIIYSH